LAFSSLLRHFLLSPILVCGLGFIQYKHDSQPSGVKWVDDLRALVRPVITYAFFLLFTTVKVSTLYVLVSEEGLTVIQALPQIWD
jgi:hypothetical protein